MIKNLGEAVKKWPEQPLLIRLDMCATMLLLNDCITERDRRKIHLKIMKLKETLNAPETSETEPVTKVRIVE